MSEYPVSFLFGIKKTCVFLEFIAEYDSGPSLAPNLIVIILGLSIAFLIEGVLSNNWNEWYFNNGITIFRKRISVQSHYKNIPTAIILERNFQSIWSNTIIFSKIKRDTLFFREKIIELRPLTYTPLMRGKLIFDNKNSCVVVIGFVNYSVLLMLGVWFWFLQYSSLPEVLLVVLITFILLAIPFSRQYAQYSRVAAFAARSWSRIDRNQPEKYKFLT